MARHSPCAPEALHLPLMIKHTPNVLSLKKKACRVVSGLTEPFSAVVGNPLAGFGTEEERAHAAVQLIN